MKHEQVFMNGLYFIDKYLNLISLKEFNDLIQFYDLRFKI